MTRRVMAGLAALFFTLWLTFVGSFGPRFRNEVDASSPHDHHLRILNGTVSRLGIVGSNETGASVCADAIESCPVDGRESAERWLYGSASGYPFVLDLTPQSRGCEALNRALPTCSLATCGDRYCVGTGRIRACGPEGAHGAGLSWVEVPGHTSVGRLGGAYFTDLLSPVQVVRSAIRYALGGRERSHCTRHC